MAKMISVLMVLAAVLAWGGCTQTSSPSPGPIGAQDILGKSLAKMAALKSYQTAIDFKLQQTTSQLEMTAQADFAYVREGPKIQGSVKTNGVIEPPEYQITIIGQDAWMEINGQWAQVPRPAMPADPGNEANILFWPDKLSILAGLTNLSKLEDDSLDGEAVYHLKGSLSSQYSGSAEVELWIEKTSLLVQKVKATGTGKFNLDLTVLVSDFDEVQQSIEPPTSFMPENVVESSPTLMTIPPSPTH